MSSARRAFITTVLFLAAGLAAAWYVGYRHGLSVSSDRGTTAFAALDLDRILGARDSQDQLLALAFRQVERVYYKPVNAQTLVDGERQGLLTFLKLSLNTKTVPLPAIGATGDQSRDIHAMDSELAYAQDHYAHTLGNTGRTELTQAAIGGMLGSLNDPYTVYLSPDQIRALDEQLDGGNFGGIGVFIYQLRNGEVLLEPIEGLPAARAGMRGEEIVQSIDGSSIGGLSLDKVERLIRGQQGTTVSIVTHPYQKRTPVRRYAITREIIHVPTVHQKIEDGYNYIRLSDFGQTSADEVRKALEAGRAAHAKGTILDLRDNGGGLLDAAVSISSYFIPSNAQAPGDAPKGVIVTEIDRQGDKEPLFANGSTLQGVAPVVVLVNGFTASASEITAGALQDYKAATLIGTKTFGKGVVQGIFSMPNGGALKITTERYVTPAGRDIQHKGIEPNILVDQKPQPDIIDTPADKQLSAAKAFLHRINR